MLSWMPRALVRACGSREITWYDLPARGSDLRRRRGKDASLASLLPRENLTDRVYALLRERIVRGAWAAGAKLPAVPSLAAELGVSRTVIREAVKALAAQGILDVIHGKGTVVAVRTGRPVTEAMRHSMRDEIDLITTMEVRIALEVEAAALAARRQTADDVANLDADLEAMALAGFDPVAFLEADVAFHAHVIDAAHNPVFVMLAQSVEQLLRETRVAVVEAEPSTRGHRGVRTHAHIRDRITAGDPVGAAEAMRRHLATVSGQIEAVLRARDAATRREA